MDTRFGQLFALLLSIQVCFAYQMYLERIPNGKIVPNPCKGKDLWNAVGHQNLRGGGLRNPFGEDFKSNGAIWNENICRKDSDGDGKTNGEELGDPECIWFIGQEPSVMVGLSHPGICEPMTDEIKCGSVPNWVNCEEKEFYCPALSEPETFRFDVRLPETPIPAKETTYTCMFVEFPTDQEYHSVAFGTNFVSEAAHHAILYGCSSDISNDVTLNTPRECDMSTGHPDCMNFILATTVGLSDYCEDDNTGRLFGGNNGFKYAAIQVHWNNPELRSGLTDSSGIKLFLTPKLRMYNKGMFTVGQFQLTIPPGEQSTTVTGVCSKQCSSQIILGQVNISGVSHHMHFLGKSQFTELRRNGKQVTILADDKVYDYNTPGSHRFENQIVALPGDEILTTCVFDSTSRTTTTFFGSATSSEMCLSFIGYHPKENIRMENIYSCSSWGSIDTCEIESGEVQGCSVPKIVFIDPQDEVVVNIGEKCSINHCRKECKEYIRVLKSIDPCYQGDVYKVRKSNLIKDIYTGGADLSLKQLQFYSRADSCDQEIALEKMIDNMDRKTGGASGVVTSVIACFVGLFLNVVLYNFEV